MAYEGAGGYDHVVPKPSLSKSPWSRLSDYATGRQYSSLSSPHEYQIHPQGAATPRSTGSQSQYFEMNAPFSSRTAMLNDGTQQPQGYPGYYDSTTGNVWRPGFWPQFPWLGMLALVVTTLATLACVIVLVKSQGVPIEQWQGRFQPTVYLSIFTATANIMLTYALYDGAVISFWRKAGQGATLQELHQYWQSGSSLWGAFQGIFQLRGKITALACIMTVLSIARGPLMQRASSVQNVVIPQNGTLNIFSAIRIPEGYAGRTTGRTSSPSMMNPNFTDIVQAYTRGDDSAGVWSGCDSICYAHIRGFGFGISCNTSSVPYVMEPLVYPNGSVLLRDPVQVFTADAGQIQTFNRNFSAYYNYALLLNTTLMSEPTQASNGSLAQHLCALRAGIVNYPIKISNNTITLQSSSWRNDTFLENVGMSPLPSNSLSNVAGFILAVKGLYYGTASMQFGGGVGWILNLNGASTNRYLRRSSSSSNIYSIESNITWRDPMEDMIDSMREIAFRTSLQIAKDNTSYANASQAVPFTGEKSETVYTANYSYMSAAVAVSLLGVFAVLPTYRGFWELGRPVSLSPLELAKAFNAPLLNSVQGNRPADEMLTELARTKVRYGDSGVPAGANVTGVYGNEEVVRRIGIGPASEVRPPEKGRRYV